MFRHIDLKIPLLLGLSFLFSCENGHESDNGVHGDKVVDGTEEMAQILVELVENGSPLDHYHWNSQLAAFFKSKVEDTSDPNHRKYWLEYCLQLLNSGDSQGCIREIEVFLHRQELEYDDLLSGGGQPILELLGLAYLRLGEQENCLSNHTPYSCILPFDEQALHSLPKGSKKAIQIFELLQGRYPNDKNQWLLNLAHMTLGSHPGNVAGDHLINYPDWTRESSDFPRFAEVAGNVGLGINGLCGGVCLEDFNNDGHIDVFATSYGMQDQVRLFFSDAHGSYEEVTSSAGLEGIVSGLNCIHADYNNDGFEDIFILRGGWLQRGGNHPNSLLRNNGDGTFSDVTKAAGLLSFHPTQTAAWADVNRDGFLDLFIGNETTKDNRHASELFINQGDGTFEEEADDFGLGQLEVFAKGTTFGDINNDGWPDLFVSVLGGNNRLFLNDSGSFEEIGQRAGVQEPKFSFPCWFWDVNNDGYDDIFVSGYDAQYLDDLAADFVAELKGAENLRATPALYINNGDNTFSDQTVNWNLHRSMYGMGANFGDLDNDGHLDFYIGTGAPHFSTVVPNRMFRNVGGSTYEEVTSAGGFGHIQKGHGVAFADMDCDGDQDIYAVMGGAFEGDLFTNVLFENPLSANNWVILELEGRSTNRSAIGTKIEITLPDKSQIFRTITTGGSFGSSCLRAEIGVEQAEVISVLKVKWPIGDEQVFENVDINSRYTLTQGDAALVEVEHSPTPFVVGEVGHEHHH